ncbi:MAG: hypothetical protein M0002_07465 [Rhodospirillales bacterium]|nr:hypothetical protein [Rhodospirillales bacterium]
MAHRITAHEGRRPRGQAEEEYNTNRRQHRPQPAVPATRLVRFGVEEQDKVGGARLPAATGANRPDGRNSAVRRLAALIIVTISVLALEGCAYEGTAAYAQGGYYYPFGYYPYAYSYAPPFFGGFFFFHHFRRFHRFHHFGHFQQPGHFQHFQKFGHFQLPGPFPQPGHFQQSPLQTPGHFPQPGHFQQPSGRFGRFGPSGGA